MTTVEMKSARDDAATDNNVAVTAKKATATPDQPDVVRDISERVRRLLECPVCLSLTTRMACLCANGHMVCSGCLILLNRQVPTPGCPMCRSPIVCDAYTLATSSGLSLITSTVKVACPYRVYGCPELFRLDQVTFHEPECAYVPTTRCLTFMCQWVGVYGQLFEHVRRFHRHVSVATTRNRLSVHNINPITSHRHQSYLVHSPTGLFWVLLFKETRNRLRIGVFFVHEDTDVRSSMELDRKKIYRVIWSDAEGRHRNQSSTAFVGCSPSSLKSWAHGTALMNHSYAIIKRNTGSLVVYWYERRLNRRIPNECIR